MQLKMEVLTENSEASRANAAQSGVRVSQQAATPQQPTVLFTTPQQLPPNQSVIQPASHASGTQSTTSVIQATSAGAIQNLKNPVILVNKSSVIQSAGQQLGEEVPLQLIPNGLINGSLAGDINSKKRLERRPSYRSIFNELSMPPQESHDMNTMQVMASSPTSDKDDTASDNEFHLKASTIQLQTELASPQYVQYTNDGHIYVPVTTSGDLQLAYQVRPAQVASASTPVVVTTGGVAQGSQPITIAEEASRKRELRLLKNREAAKECRRKKKDYIKCLEERVNLLETQNATLIDELKALKDLYCKKSVEM